MDFNCSILPYVVFKLIRKFVGEKYPRVKMELRSTVFKQANHVCKYLYAIPHTTEIGIDWTIDSFRGTLNNEKYNRILLALGHLIYVRTIHVFNEDLFQFERNTFHFPAFRPIWSMTQFVTFICQCEAHLRDRHNNNLGHMFCDGIALERIKGIIHVFPFLH